MGCPGDGRIRFPMLGLRNLERLFCNAPARKSPHARAISAYHPATKGLIVKEKIGKHLDGCQHRADKADERMNETDEVERYREREQERTRKRDTGRPKMRHRRTRTRKDRERERDRKRRERERERYKANENKHERKNERRAETGNERTGE